MVAAPAAFAQYHQAVPVAQAPMPAVVQPSCGPRPAPRAAPGQWELQTTQQYVPGVTQQVWVAGQCTGNPRKPWKQRCTPGRYVTTQTAGRYETQQRWVWVAYDDHRSDRRHGRHSHVEFNVGFR